MKILKALQVQEADKYTMKTEPILSINLMERAAGRCTEKIAQLYDYRSNMHIFAGPGNNGGDGLVIARKLFEKGYEVNISVLKFTDKFSDDFKTNLKRLEKFPEIEVCNLENADDFPQLNKNDVIIDAIFGSGLSRPAEGLAAEIIKKINETNLPVLSIDAPSGLQTEENPPEFTAIKAKHTFTFEFPFLSFFFAENQSYTGEFHIISIGLSDEYIKKTSTDFHMAEAAMIKPLIKSRSKFSHKGTYGHGLLLAGSYGKAGASLLAAEAAYRSGAGLITAGVPAHNYRILQTALPEAMLHIDSENEYLSVLPDLSPFDAIAVGPGIGFHQATETLLENLIDSTDKPIIFDADALTILSKRPDLLKKIPVGSILTPHPKEFERLAGKQKNHYRRLKRQQQMAKELRSVIILKGAHTSICMPDGKCTFNTTGNPGMATGGSGDVLTGMLLGLKAQGYSSEEAALIGVYLHGAAGDRAAEKKGQESMIAGDITDHIRFTV
jgi:NAD(P)H-hydrate epimerase